VVRVVTEPFNLDGSQRGCCFYEVETSGRSALYKDREKGGSDHKFEKEVTTDRLRDLLGDITYHWCSDQWTMRKTERTFK
jgi:hypothetical protein